MKPVSAFKKGIFLTLGSYFIWGNFPLYWYPLKNMEATQLVAHRIAWSMVFLVLMLILTRQYQPIINIFTTRKKLITLIVTSQLLFANWFIFLWAITKDHILDASLGNFITPLISIFLGRIFLKEPLNISQYIALSVAFLGVLWLAVAEGIIPYVALWIALSFGLYGLLKKNCPIETIPALTVETLFMMPFALGYLGYVAASSQLIFSELSILGKSILIFSGVATTLPLLMFSEATKHIPLSLIGIIQFSYPTLLLINGLVFFNESLPLYRLLGFFLVWIAIGIFLYSLRYKPKQTR